MDSVGRGVRFAADLNLSCFDEMNRNNKNSFNIVANI